MAIEEVETMNKTIRKGGSQVGALSSMTIVPVRSMLISFPDWASDQISTRGSSLTSQELLLGKS